jgi:hypothetical protein
VTRYVSPLKRANMREVAHTVKTVAGAVAMLFLAISSATVAIGAIDLVIRFWR